MSRIIFLCDKSNDSKLEYSSLLIVKGENYMYIKPSYLNKIFSEEQLNYNSKLNPLSKEELKEYLVKLNLL